MKKRFLLITLFSVLSNMAFSYTYEELSHAMSANNPELQKLQEEYNRSLLDVKDAWAGLGPTVNLQVSGTYMVNPPVDAIYLNVDDVLNAISWPSGVKPAGGSQPIKIYGGMEDTLYNFQLSVTQPIFTWGKIANSISLYKQISEIKETQLLSQQEKLEMELETRLITLNFLNRILTILDEEQSYASRLVQVSEEAQKTGMLLYQDVVEAWIQAKELDIAQQDLHEQIKNQLLELQQITGIEDLTYEQIEYSFDEEAVMQILQSDRQRVEENALSGNNLSIKMLTQLKGVQSTAEKISKGYVNWKPDVALQMSGGYSGSRFPFVEKNWNRKDDYSLNISVGIQTTIWDGGKKLRDVSRKASEVKTADINQLDARSAIKKTLSSQWNTADVCTIKIEYQDLKIESADSKIQNQQLLFNSGYGSETDLLSAKIDKCNQQIEREKQSLNRAVACMTINFLGGE